MKIYTRKGDRGRTSVLGGGVLSKADARIRALGALDETNAALGVILASNDLPDPIRKTLERVQNVLFEAGAALASVDASTGASLFAVETIWLESEIDRVEEQLRPLQNFILPGGGTAGALLHWARTVARRAETFLVEAAGNEEARVPLVTWFNRLSDALFVLARLANALQGIPETVWESRFRGERHSGAPPAGSGPDQSPEGR